MLLMVNMSHLTNSDTSLSIVKESPQTPFENCLILCAAVLEGTFLNVWNAVFDKILIIWAFLQSWQNVMRCQRFTKVLMWTGISQVIRIYWVHLCWSPSAGCSQSAGRFYQRAAVHLLRWSCVFRESTPSVGSLRFVCVCDSFFVFWLVSTHSVLTPTSPLVFWVQCFLSIGSSGNRNDV